MKKIIIIISTFIFSICLSLGTIHAKVDISEMYSRYDYVYDLTGQHELYGDQETTKMFPASMTKMLTVYTAIPMIKNLDAKIKINKKDIDRVWSMGASHAGFKENEVVTYRDLLYGVLYPSGADACWALARVLCGNEENFVKKMNDTAQKIGMKDSHFVTSTGLHDDNHYSTVKDMALLLKVGLQDKTFRSVFTGDKYYTSSNKRLKMASTLTRIGNRTPVKPDAALKGAKSGYTVPAMYCLASVAQIHDHEVIIVTGYGSAEKIQDAFSPGCALSDHNKIVNDLKNNYKSVTLIPKSKKAEIKVKFGKKDTYQVDMPLLKRMVPQDFNEQDLKVKYTLFNQVKAPLKKGTYLGSIKVTYQSKELLTQKVLAQENIEISRFKYVSYYALRIILALVVIFFIIKIFRRKRKKRK